MRIMTDHFGFTIKYILHNVKMTITILNVVQTVSLFLEVMQRL